MSWTHCVKGDIDMVRQRTSGFTLIELLVVIFIISLLTALGLTAARLVRLQAQDLLCKSNLRQMGLIQTTYGQENDHLFPNPKYLYYSENLQRQLAADKQHLGCIWHDKTYALDGPLMTQNTSAQGVLVPYLGDKSIQICKVNALASQERGCPNGHDPNHRDFTPPLPVNPAYSYTMNLMLYRRIHTPAGGPVCTPAGAPYCCPSNNPAECARPQPCADWARHRTVGRAADWPAGRAGG